MGDAAFYAGLFAEEGVLRFLHNGAWKASTSGALTSISNPSKGGVAYRVQGARPHVRSRTVRPPARGAPGLTLAAPPRPPSLHGGRGGGCLCGRARGPAGVGADAAAQALRAAAQGCGAAAGAQGPHRALPRQRDCKACQGRHRGSGVRPPSRPRRGQSWGTARRPSVAPPRSPPAAAPQVRSADLIDYTAEEGIRLLCEGEPRRTEGGTRASDARGHSRSGLTPASSPLAAQARC